MGWIINNPLGTMYGPYFLILYLGVIVGVISLVGYAAGNADRSIQFNPIPLPMQPDAFELAYVRGGAAEVARLVIYDLVRKGALTRVSDKPPRLQTAGPGEAGQPPVYQIVQNYFATPQQPHSFLTARNVAAVEDLCRPYAENAVHQCLLMPAESRQKIGQIKGVGVLAILALGAYKLIAALSTGHTNVGFLIVMGLIGSIVLASWIKAPRLSKRGSQYLNQVQTAFSQLRSKPALGTPLADNSSMLIAAGIFGFVAINQLDPINARMFGQAAPTGGCGSSFSGSSCSGGSGSGCSSGGGGGGGCGGGGGGGCGGCGGGG